jgi:hypothetical protein
VESLDKLKKSVKRLAHAIKNANDEMPMDAEIETIIDCGCDIFADAVQVVKEVWRR